MLLDYLLREKCHKESVTLNQNPCFIREAGFWVWRVVVRLRGHAGDSIHAQRNHPPSRESAWGLVVLPHEQPPEHYYQHTRGEEARQKNPGFEPFGREHAGYLTIYFLQGFGGLFVFEEGDAVLECGFELADAIAGGFEFFLLLLERGGGVFVELLVEEFYVVIPIIPREIQCFGVGEGEGVAVVYFGGCFCMRCFGSCYFCCLLEYVRELFFVDEYDTIDEPVI